MDSKPFCIVLLPEPSLKDKAIQISSSLKGRGVYYTLDGSDFHPHLSLYMVQLDEAGLEETINRLDSISEDTSAVQAVADRYHYSFKYLDVEYTKLEEMTTLQQRIIEGINPIRNGLRERDKERLATSQGEELSNILKYGYRSVGNAFRPHLTFTRFTSEQKDVISSLPPKETFSGSFDNLGIFSMGEHGTCVRLIKDWSL